MESVSSYTSLRKTDNPPAGPCRVSDVFLNQVRTDLYSLRILTPPGNSHDAVFVKSLRIVIDGHPYEIETQSILCCSTVT